MNSTEKLKNNDLVKENYQNYKNANDCSLSIQYYLQSNELIKRNLNKIYNECPEKVVKLLLSPEFINTQKALINCNWGDKLDKNYLNKLLITKCNDIYEF